MKHSLSQKVWDKNPEEHFYVCQDVGFAECASFPGGGKLNYISMEVV